ncbi:MAG: ATP-binding cassette domain-containing protein [Candidatus Lokiarchaeota archaeon]|nr:ATP-binding cassette domain-containing protein [Candidatus Lokiarchaeota archaeon]
MKVVKVENLTKIFNEGKTRIKAVDNLSFSVEEGEVFGFLGPNGAGKTTTIFMLTTLLSPTSYSTAEVLSYDIKKSPNQIRKNIGVVFQDIVADERLTGRENLRFHAKYYGMRKSLYKSRINELLELVELKDRAKDKVETYSGGMKRRLEIARGLLNRPKILFLDEMTLGLDPTARRRIWDYIKALNEQGITIIITSHYLDEIDFLADRIIIIDKGKKLELDTPENLKNKLGKDSLRITGTGDVDKTIKHLKPMKIVKKITTMENKNGFIVGLNIPGSESIPILIDAIKEINFEIKELKLQKPSLDDVFIHYTGRKMEEENRKMPKSKQKFRDGRTQLFRRGRR